MKNISILGATGSVGRQTIDVVRKNKDKYCIKGVSANINYKKIIEIIEEFRPTCAALMDKSAYNRVKEYCRINNLSTEVYEGLDGLNKIASNDETDIVVTSVVGMIGLVPTIEAIEAGKDIALANKETLVAAGQIVMKLAQEKGVNIFPVDSEHSAIFQCLQGNKKQNINKILLTASGGPFRGRNKKDLRNIKADEALKHPNWNMGKKISIDSSTFMNKGLEVIETHWLFGVDYENIQVVVHPQSIIHSMIEYIDGSIIAQLAAPDMKLPIQYALNYPERQEAVIKKLDFYSINSLTFEKPDIDTFRCMYLAYEAGKMGGNMPTVLNSANEAAVGLFLQDKIKYLQIEEIIEQCMNKFEYVHNPDLEYILYNDLKVREYVENKYK